MLFELLINRCPGILITAAILLPNLVSIFLPPRNLPEVFGNRKHSTILFLTIIERIGQTGIFSSTIFFTFKINKTTDKVFAVCSLLSFAVYYICWLRFFLGGRDFYLLFSPLFLIPIPLAVFPVLCFAAVARVERSFVLLAFTVIFAIGHLPLSYFEYLKSRNNQSLVI